MKDLFSIGEVSKIKEITIKSLRYYHSEGILIPKHIDKITGYRYYSIDQFIYIDIIKTCRMLDCSINEIKEIFKERDTEKLLKFLELKKIEAKERINKMREVIKNIDTLDSLIKFSREKVKDKNVKLEKLEKRYIIKSPCKEAGNLKEVIYYSYLDKEIKEKDIIPGEERGIIYNLDLENNLIPEFVFNKIIYNEDYLKINNKDIKYENIDILPEGKYLTAIYNSEDVDENRKNIISYAKENNFEIKKVIVVEIFDDMFNIDTYNCQIQILIEENKH